jgi:hypothetical protein
VTATATIADFAYTPDDVVIHAGDTVVWRNDDRTVHTVTASRGEFISGSMRAGQSYTVRFNTPGVYPYFCEPHEFMRGTVSVLPAPGSHVSALATPRTEAGAVSGHVDAASPVGAFVATVAGVALVALFVRRLHRDAARTVAVLATLATAALHLQLRLMLDYPEPIGTLLVIEAGGAVVLAAWVATGDLTRRKRGAAAALHFAALVALGVTRTSLGLFGFHELGWDPAPQLPLAIAFGVVAIASLTLGTVLRSQPALPVE